MGTYEPEVNNMLVTKVTKRPACDPGVKLVFGIKVGLYERFPRRTSSRRGVLPIRRSLLKSIAPNKDRREVIRKTWGSATNFEDYPAKIVFLLGIEENPSNRKSKVRIQCCHKDVMNRP